MHHEDCYPNIIAKKNFSFKIVDIDIEDLCESGNNGMIPNYSCEKFNDKICNFSDIDNDENDVSDENYETDLEEEIRKSKFGTSGLWVNIG